MSLDEQSIKFVLQHSHLLSDSMRRLFLTTFEGEIENISQPINPDELAHNQNKDFTSLGSEAGVPPPLLHPKQNKEAET